MRASASRGSHPFTLPRQHSTLQVILSFAPYLWPKDNPGRAGSGLAGGPVHGLAKAAAVYVPILYARTIDALTKPDQSGRGAAGGC